MVQHLARKSERKSATVSSLHGTETIFELSYKDSLIFDYHSLARDMHRPASDASADPKNVEMGVGMSIQNPFRIVRVSPRRIFIVC